jgi:M6 family metalloprotease-like protein
VVHRFEVPPEYKTIGVGLETRETLPEELTASLVARYPAVSEDNAFLEFWLPSRWRVEDGRFARVEPGENLIAGRFVGRVEDGSVPGLASIYILGLELRRVPVQATLRGWEISEERLFVEAEAVVDPGAGIETVEPENSRKLFGRVWRTSSNPDGKTSVLLSVCAQTVGPIQRSPEVRGLLEYQGPVNLSLRGEVPGLLGLGYFFRVRAVAWGVTEPIPDPTPPSSQVDPILPCYRVEPFPITASAEDDLSGIRSVELWYRFSPDGREWGPWRRVGGGSWEWDRWSWTFEIPEGTGRYEFYSVATDRAGNREDPPPLADTRCVVPGPPVVLGPEIVLEEAAAPITSVAFSPDHLAYSSMDGRVYIHRTSDWGLEAVLGAGGPVRQVSFSPDGRLVACGGDDMRVYVHRTSDWARVLTLEVATAHVHSVSFSRTGRWLAFGTGWEDGNIYVFDTSDWGEVARVRHWYACHIKNSVDFSPDDAYLAFTAAYYGTYIVRTGDWAGVKCFGGPVAHGYNRYSVRFSPDGRWVAWAQDWDQRVLVHRHDPGADWPQEKVLEKPGDPIYALDFSPTGDLIAFGGGRGRVYVHETVCGVEVWELEAGGQISERSVRFSPDGRWIACGSTDGGVYLYPLADNTPPVSSVDPIEPYWQLGELRDPPSDMRLRTPIKITATASDDLSGVARVELWYRYSLDNWTDTVAWKKRPWRLYGVDDNGADGWSWEFDAPEGYGYYEFYTIVTDRARNVEGPPTREWIQTSKKDFESGKLENLDVQSRPGSVMLDLRQVFQDDFENYRIGEFPSAGGWENLFGLSFVTGEVSVSGSKSLQLQNAWVRRSIPDWTRRWLGYEAWIRTEGGDEGQGIGFNLRIAFLNFGEDGYISFEGLRLQPFQENRWYHVEVILDKESGRGRVWIDGELMGEAEVPRARLAGELWLLAGYASHRLFLDDVVLKAGYCPSGVITSTVHDSGRYGTNWGNVSWTENCPEGADIILQTRSGDTETPDPSWSDWSAPYENHEGESITSPPARYIQYRAVLTVRNPDLSPALCEVKITYPVADAGCRVARELLRIATIFAEPSDVEWEDVGYSKGEFDETVKDYRGFFDEASYGSVFAIVDNFDNGWRAYKLKKPWRDYIEEYRFPDGRLDNRFKPDFVKDAIELVKGTEQKFDYDAYKAIIVTGAVPIINNRQLDTRAYCLKIGEKLISCGYYNRYDDWAHETGHALGLPDLYPYDPRWWYPWDFVGDIGRWGLMGSGFPNQHFCSWTKERLGWLKYRDVSAFHGDILSLPCLGYNGKVIRRFGYRSFGDTYYLFEVRFKESIQAIRDRNFRYSAYDYNHPSLPFGGGGLVVYKHEDPWIGDSTLTVVPNPRTGENYFVAGDEHWLEPPYYHWLWPDHPGILLSVLENTALENWYQMKIHVRESWGSSGIVARLEPFPSWRLKGGRDTSPTWPDLDLHAYTPRGEHVGMNYRSGKYEIQIPGARASGDLWNSSEWIWVPAGTEVYFFVSSRDVSASLESGLVLENENGLYSLTVSYWDENLIGSGSDIENQMILPGAEVFHGFEVTWIDKDYRVEVKRGMNLIDLETWRVAVLGIPDHLFVNRPLNRKEALINKFEAVFKMLREKNYKGAIEKLEKDILEKLNADGKADWVHRPVLVNEIRALVSMLKTL